MIWPIFERIPYLPTYVDIFLIPCFKGGTQIQIWEGLQRNVFFLFIMNYLKRLANRRPWWWITGM